MDRWLQDLRYSVRRLARQPGFTLTALLTLGLGIGANVALFSLLNAVLIRATPGVRAPERLVVVYTSDYSGPPFGTSAYPDYEEIAGATDVFEGVTAVSQTIAGVGRPENPTRVGVELVSPEYFEVLGVPLRGRAFSRDEATQAAPVAVVSDAFWRSALAASPDALGREVLVNGRAVTVVGIAGRGFRGMQRGFAGDIWLPLLTGGVLGIGPDQATLMNRGNRSLGLIARLRPGTRTALARDRLESIASQLHAAFPQNWTDVRGEPRRLSMVPERAARIPPQGRSVAFGFAGVLGAMVGLVLLICCANLAGLMLARVTSRSREVAIRLSIGATRARIRALLLSESLLLAAGGAVLGLTASMWAMDAATGLILRTAPVPVDIDLSPDARVLAFTLLIGIVAAVLFGTAPALRASRTELADVLKGDAALTKWRGRRIPLRNVLVSGQVAASLVLLVGALLFLRSLRAAADPDMGYTTRDVLLVDVEPRPGYDVPAEEHTRVALELSERLASLPFVRATTWADHGPVGPGAGNRRGTWVEGYTRSPGEDMEFHYNIVGPRYFETVGMMLTRGRDFTAQDRTGAAGVVVVNEAFARRFWPGEDALGKRVSVTGPEGEPLTVVGVARDARLVDVGGDVRPHMFLPALANPGNTLLHVRTNGDAAEHADAVRGIVEDAAPRWIARDVRTLEAQVAASVLPQRLAGYLLSGFGLLALLLACVGLYGVVAYAVAQRTREMGIRYALGATPRMMLGFTARHALRLVLGGLLAGLVLSFAAGRLLRSLLLGMDSVDALSFVTASVLMLTVAMVAVYVPARRVMRLDPLSALRAE